MNVKHFFKILGGFLFIIILSVVAFFVVNYFEQNEKSANGAVNPIQVAK